MGETILDKIYLPPSRTSDYHMYRFFRRRGLTKKPKPAHFFIIDSRIDFVLLFKIDHLISEQNYYGGF